MIDSIDHITLKIAFLAYKCLDFAINMQCCYGLYYVRLLNMGLDTRKPVFRFANNKGPDQPAHPGKLISAFVIHLLKIIISKLATSEISIF